MSAKAQWPWSELGLDTANGKDVTEREVRRAYATRLKSLDAEKNPAAFEALRTAYEFARKIAAQGDARKAASPAQEDLTDPPPSLTEVAPPSALILSELNDIFAAAIPDQSPEPAATEVPAPPNVPPNVPPKSPFAPPLPAQDFPILGEAAFGKVIEDMNSLVMAGEYSVGAWQKLLGAPVLEDLKFARRFEGAFLAILERSQSSGTGAFRIMSGGASPQWAELIEARFGWVADGLRFQNLFPGQARVRSLLAQKLPKQPLFADAPLPQKAQKALPVGSSLKSALLIALSPLTFAFLFILLVVGLALYIKAPVWYYLAFAAISTAGFIARSALPFVVVTTKSLKRFSLDRVFKFLVGVQVAVIASSTAMALLSCVLLTEAALNGFARQRISLADVEDAWLEVGPNIAANPLMQSPYDLPFNIRLDETLAPLVSAVARADLNTPDVPPLTVEGLGPLNLPYPHIRAKISGARIDSNLGQADDFTKSIVEQALPKRAERFSHLACNRAHICVLSFGSDLLVQTAVRLRGAESLPVENVLRDMSVRGQWDLDKPQNAIFSASLELVTLAIPTSVQDLERISRDPTFKSNIYFAENVVDVPTLTFAAQPPTKDQPAKLIATAAFEPDEPIFLPGCVGRIAPYGMDEILALNPKKDALIRELCTLPAGMFSVAFGVCPRDPETGDQRCDYIGDVYTNLVQVDPATTPIEEVFDQPLDLALMASLQPDTPLPPEAVNQAAALSDKIIADYLTVFWDQPVPEPLAAYLARNPQIPRHTSEPNYDALVLASAYQPHLAPLYAVRAKVAEAVLGDMFAFLGRMRMLRP